MDDRVNAERWTSPDRDPDGGERSADVDIPTEAVLLCGGRGSRLGGTIEKPLVDVGGRPMVSRVIGALAASRIERVVAVSSPHTPETTRYIRRHGSGVRDITIDVREGSGAGYVTDLDRGLAAVDGVAVTVVSDLPLIRSSDIDDAVDAWIDRADTPVRDVPDSVSVCVTPGYKRGIGVSVGTTVTRDGRELCPSGVNVVSTGVDDVLVWNRETIAVNVNTQSDLAVARTLAESP